MVLNPNGKQGWEPARIERQGGSAPHPQCRLPLAVDLSNMSVIYCLAVRLARKPQKAVSYFCDIDETDQFWVDPPGEDNAGLDCGEAGSNCQTESPSHRVLWFRFRRIAYLSER